MIDYTALEAVHVTAVVLSGPLFALRAWRVARPDAPFRRAALVFGYIESVALSKSPAGALRALLS